MKSMKKALLLLLCAVLVVGASVFGTLAYLTDTEAVTNTFSVGSVGLSLDEAKVTPDGVPVPDADRVQDNTYHLLPGLTYTKDPIIHVDADSSDSYIFVKVDNQIAAYEAESGDGYTDIADQIAANGWEVLEEGGNVYWKAYTEGQKDENGQPLLDLPVFAQFQVAGNANLLEGWEDIQADDPATEEDESTVIRVTGYAVQKAGFDTALDAWNATFGQDDGEIPGESEAPDPSEDPDPSEEPDPSETPDPSEEPDPDPSTPGGGEEPPAESEDPEDDGLVTTFTELTTALAEGGEIKLGADIDNGFDYPLRPVKDVVLDLNGKTLFTSCSAPIMVESPCNVTIKNGSIISDSTSSASHILYCAGKNVSAILENVTFTGPERVVVASTSTNVTIYSGTFTGKRAINVENGGIMTIYGGKFQNDPSAYIAPGYKAELIDDYYVVTAE